MKKIYKRILSLGLAVGVIFSLQESVHICAQENTQTTESIFADYGDENGGETDTAEQITGTGAEENTEQTTEETETGKNTEQTTEETETGKNTELTTETETGEIMDADDTEEAEESVWMMYDGTEAPEEPDEPELDEGFHQDGSVAINEMNFPDDVFRPKIEVYDKNRDGILSDSENRKITKLEFEKSIETNGIEYLSYLKKLVLADDICSVMNSSSLEEIEMSDAYTDNHLRVVSFAGCTALKSLSIDASINSDAGIDFTGCKKLETLTIRKYMGAALDLSPCIALKKLDIENLYGKDRSSTAKLDLNSQQKLLELSLKAVKLSDDFVLPRSVQKVHVERISSKKLDLSNYKNLKEFSMKGSTENLQLNGCANLTKLDIEDYYLKTLNLSGCSRLTEFDTLDQDNLKNIDFTGCKGLK